MHLRHSTARRALLCGVTFIAMLVSGSVAAGPAGALLPPGWIERGSGCLSTLDPNDHICYEIRLNAMPQPLVGFSLEDINRRHKRKAIMMADGLGSEWSILSVDPSQGHSVDKTAILAHQIHNGQRLRFYKGGEFGISVHVMNLGGLEQLKPGTLVRFRWLRDSPDN